MFPAAKIKNYILLSILIIIPTVICYLNFNSGTYLSGWDTIHSEFDFKIAFSRILSPAFMDHQGLGAVSSQSHLADLPRIIFIYFLSFIFSENFLRYSYVFLMLIIGPVGVYQFLKELLNQAPEDEENDSHLLPSFIGSLSYLTNLSVVQHFNVPLEMFVTFFGFLGFIFWAILRCQREFTKKNFAWLILFSFLISPASHTATLFYMFLLFTGIYLLVNVLTSDDKRVLLKRSSLILTGIITTNLFWILPNIYFILTHGNQVASSKINTLFSDQAYLSNLSFGDFSDIAILKNYLFIWQIWDKNKFIPLLGPWFENLNTGIILFGYAVFFFSILGIGLSLVRKDKKLFGFIVTFIFCAIFIGSSKSVAGGFIDYLRNNIPFLQEALRFPFNKFSTLFSLSISVFLAYFFYLFFGISKKEYLNIVFTLMFAVFSCVYFLPAFKGNLINPLMRITYDNSYFELFDYFKNQPEYGRVADLPVHSVYGWTYYNFGYQGAGFLWFGIDKPLLNREFDRWESKNEDYFDEMSFAIYNDNPKQLENVLNKYQIRWVMVDQNVISPGDNASILHNPETLKTLSQVSNLKLDKKIGENIYIYKYFPQVEFAKQKLVENSSFLSNETFRESQDLAFNQLGNYYSVKSPEVTYGLKTATEVLNPNLVTSDQKNITIANIKGIKANQIATDVNFSYPILKILDGKNPNNLKIKQDSDYISLNSTLISDQSSQSLSLNQINSINLWKKGEEIKFDELKNYLSVINCGVDSQGTSYSLEQKNGGLVINSKYSDTCVNLDLRDLLKAKSFDSYVISFDAKSSAQMPSFCSINNFSCFKEVVGSKFQKLLSKNDTNLRIFNKSDSDTNSEVLLTNIKITLIKSLGTVALNLPQELFAKSDSLVIKKDLEFSGSLDRFGFNPRICGRTDSIKSEIGVFNSSDFNICDSYNINYDPNSYSILEIISKNYAGLPLRLCLQNTLTFRCDAFLALPKNKDLKTNYILLPPFKGPHKLVFTNQVVEGNVSKNEIAYMSIVKFDYLNSFSLEKNSTTNLYYLDSSYDNGFVALCDFNFCSYKHVLVNNWANGWVVPDNFDPSKVDVKIIFWPNLLPLAGLILFIITISLTLWLAFNPIVIDKTE